MDKSKIKKYKTRQKNTGNTLFVLICLVFLLSSFPPTGLAHDTFITIDRSDPSPSAFGTFFIYSSHHFPPDAQEHIAADGFYDISIVSPSGLELSASANNEGIYGPTSHLTETGTYMAVGEPTKSIIAKVTQKYSQDQFKKFSKAIFTMGKPGGETFSKPLKHSLEIIPLTNPSTLRVGDILPVKVMRAGKIAKKKVVFSTYEKFSNSPNTFAYTTRTNNDGIAEIKILQKGRWLLITKHMRHSSNKSDDGRLDWRASLTFFIR